MDLEQYRQVISNAIQAEIDAKQFYEQVGEKIKDAYLKTVFADLATEEAKHERILTGILEKGKMETGYFNFEKDFKVAETIEMPVVDADMDLKSAIGIAMKNEEAAMKTYQSLADNCQDKALKAVFLDLSAMERGHKFKLEKDFVGIAYPEVW
jgi:rubrerythrin